MFADGASASLLRQHVPWVDCTQCSFGSRSPIIVFDSDDIILAKIAPGLDLD